ncbi:hypothetical protein BU25DRAFT_349317 [Macroventuria anomochaeta]|uniref:Uncharacterized protein n=1 Tax=Macroventuria anomochaeta TaxID=301207 RepID=A0ACB6RQ33_9PLEO|nr:uncharacterized protein BU25DRAFT_349317 [Macroventuria anomochaeta]KAF2623822.1 hypothetical protein BU25DRAFT_349317 [Macroventuria anomochaeta]
MSVEYKGQNPLDIAKQAEKDLNSHANAHGTDPNTANPNPTESGIDESAVNKFPDATVIVGSGASGAGNNHDIPESEGGDINPATGKLYKAGDFEKGVGAPEVKDASYAKNHGGEPDANAPVRQGQGQTGKP